MLDLINAKKSDHMFTLFLTFIWGVVNATFGRRPEAVDYDAGSIFLLAMIIGLSSAAILGWIVSKFTKIDSHVLLVANWVLIIGIVIRCFTSLF